MSMTPKDIDKLEKELNATDASKQTKGSYVISEDGKAFVRAMLKKKGGAFKVNAEMFLKKLTDATPEYITTKVKSDVQSPFWPVGQTADKQFDDVKVTGNGKGKKATLKFVLADEEDTEPVEDDGEPEDEVGE